MTQSEYITVDRTNPQHVQALTRVWNAASGAEFATTPAAVVYDLLPCTGAVHTGQLILVDGQPAAFALATAMTGDPSVNAPQAGWLDALMVAQQVQHQGLGSQLMLWAEGWLRTQGCTRYRLAGSLRPFAPSLPERWGTLPFFEQHGFVQRGGDEIWDVSRDLGDGQPIRRKPAPSAEDVHPARPQDHNRIVEFFRRAFPGRWRYEYEEFIGMGGRHSDFLVLDLNGKIEGFCWLTWRDSARPLERFFMHRLPQPWGQLGPIGVSAEVRGGGWGGILLQEGLAALQAGGVRGCVIDWTDLVDFYGKYGFKPYTRFLMLTKELR